MRCKACGYERLLPFSCKGRLCPSCQARRMHDLALHLVTHVVPAVPLRQFVLGVPRALRFPLARDAALRRATVGILVRTVFMRQRRLARADGFPHVMRARRVGVEVTFDQPLTALASSGYRTRRTGSRTRRRWSRDWARRVELDRAGLQRGAR